MNAPSFKGRISDTNLSEYLKTAYGADATFVQIGGKLISFEPLLQNNYGKTQDCTLTSITALTNYVTKKQHSVDSIYNGVESIALGYFYNGDKWGTVPVFIKKVLEKTLANFYKRCATKSGYFKGVGVRWGTIVNQINRENPIIMNLFKDGKDYYYSHSITVVGYRVFKVGAQEVRMLAVYDNWYKTVSYIDFAHLSNIVSINYIA